MMTYANYTIRVNTNSSAFFTVLAICVLSASTVLILYFEVTTQIVQIGFIGGIYAVLTIGSWLFSRMKKKQINNS
jgi:hypothetical protein